MLDVEQRCFKHHQLSLAPWLYQALTDSGESLRVRLRGNNLHILCEDILCPEATKIVSQFKSALQSQGKNPMLLSGQDEQGIEQVLLYGRAFGQHHHDWVESIVLNSLNPELADDSTLLISNESLARSGSVTAIARLLNDSFSHLGVKVKVLLQKFPSKGSETDNKRLWVICQCNYSPDPSLLAEPIAQKLRDLRLEGFREAVIRSLVQGEEAPDWVLRVDLTHPNVMLRDWARWGDIQSLSRLLNRALAVHHWEFGAILKDVTLHIFCRVLEGTQEESPDQETAVGAIADLLKDIAPQGIEAATIYGIKESSSKMLLNRPDAEDHKPDWVDWVKLPTSPLGKRQPGNLSPSGAEDTRTAVSYSPLLLASQGNHEALIFLLQRLLNPDLDERLATGGIRVKLCRKQDLLHIMTEAISCPVQDQITSSIIQLLRQLGLPQVNGVRIYGRRAGQSYPLWHYGEDFVRRNRLAPITSPEFATLDTTDVQDLEGEPSLVHQQRPLHWLQEGWQQICDFGKYSLQHLLCTSRLFILEQSSDPVSLSYRQTEQRFFNGDQGVKIVLVWSTLGLLVTLQVDWLGGQLLRRIQPQTRTATATTSAIAPTVEPVILPELSLRQSPADNEEVFEGGGFTQAGSQEIVVHGQTVSNPGIAATLEVLRTANPSFNNPILDNKLALYQQRVLQRGVPDILIVGSSRAMRGIDTVALQNALSSQGYGDLEIFNFGVNGATAQVVDLILRRLIPSEQLPKLIVWADGARAFNSGRFDLTYEAIASSVGYETLEAGNFPNPIAANQEQGTAQSKKRPNLQGLDPWLNQTLGQFSAIYPQRKPLKRWLSGQLIQQTQGKAENSPATQVSTPEDSEMDLDGFLPIPIRFNPDIYYDSHPRVVGAYDGDYQSFNLNGEQYELSLELLNFLQKRQINLVFVNLPLTQDYLDAVRIQHEETFKQHLNEISLNHGLIFRNLVQLWPDQYDLFSDPSHLNRYGAYQVSLQLAQDPMIPWPKNLNQ